ncbi:MAG TPA: protein kinase, partial [Vicinamibacterales bacterium]|nr:protein kinase [Vicinamibacterales bacterium]
MALAPGTRLGSYEIVAAIGAGGMGEVYKAHDARLGRDVAVKVLPGSFAADPDRSARFDREARLLASLNHPNIAQIYGLERAGDVPFIVMELIDGETLSDRLRSGALPVREALTIAAQIADGLDAAHARGIVHRDLKPSNVAVTRGAQVKILDFGLATTADAVDSSLLTHSPTMLGQTASGVLLGTAPYMSPEQARGKAVDKRTDIWAFGCVLFEMLTGKAAFSGPTVSDAIARVLEREPDWTSLPGQVDPSIRRVLRRCLQKELKERFHDVADVRLALADAADGTHTDAARNAHPSRTPWIPILALVAIALAVTTWMSWRGAGAAEPRPLVEFGINLGDNAPGFGAALSPDGRRVAVGTEIAGRNQIWMHAFDGSAGGPLPGGEYGIFPFWSPDGSALAFFSFTTGTLSRVPASGGSPTKICATNDSIVRPLERRGGITGGSWNAAGAIIFGAGGRLFRVPAAGGVPVRLATPGDADESVTQSSPQFLPDGQHFVYVSTGSLGEGTVAIGSLDGAPVRRLARARRAAFVAPGLLLLLQGTSLTAQRFDASALKLQGEPSVVAANVGAGYVDGTETFDARDNLLVFVPMLAGNHGRLTWFDRSGHPLDALRPTDPSEYLNPVLSPRGDRVAVNRLDFQTGIWNVWAVDVARDTATRITNGPNDSTDAVWSPDESELAFTTRRDGHFAL